MAKQVFLSEDTKVIIRANDTVELAQRHWSGDENKPSTIIYMTKEEILALAEIIKSS